jgi:hypothetical protein
VNIDDSERGAQLALDAVSKLVAWATKYLQETARLSEDKGMKLDGQIVRGGTTSRYQLLFEDGWTAVFSGSEAADDEVPLFGKQQNAMPGKIAFYGVAFRTTDGWVPQVFFGGFTKVKALGAQKRDARTKLTDLLRELLPVPPDKLGGRYERSVVVKGLAEGNAVVSTQRLLSAKNDVDLGTLAEKTVAALKDFWAGNGA